MRMKLDAKAVRGGEPQETVCHFRGGRGEDCSRAGELTGSVFEEYVMMLHSGKHPEEADDVR